MEQNYKSIINFKTIAKNDLEQYYTLQWVQSLLLIYHIKILITYKYRSVKFKFNILYIYNVA